MSAGHNHGHHVHEDIKSGISGKRLAFTVALNFVITLAEAAGGFFSGSLALISDALHNFSDGIAVFIAYMANLIGNRKSTNRRTFGYKRIEIIAALFNSVALIAICIFLFVEAIRRINNPEPVKGLLMLIVAVIGFIANLAAVLILKEDSDKNLNVRAAFLHLMGDTVSSAAVIVSGVLIYFYQFYWLDPIVTIFIGLYIVRETYSIVRETISILMQSVPKDMDIEKIQKDIEQIEEVRDVHHIHVWSLDDRNVLFDCHIDLEKDMKTSDTDAVRMKVEELLYHKYKISHVTIQAEYNCCTDKKLLMH